MLMYATLLPHQKKGSNLDVKKMLPFVWDDETKQEVNAEITTFAEVMEAKARWQKRDKKK